jgi:lactate dehydrogenase-like 2-hydroxyacid dehydrogenase
VFFKVEAPAFRQALIPDFVLHDLALDDQSTAARAVRARGRILVTTGFVGASRREIEALPNLGLISCLGTGYENVDLDAARERGIAVTHGAGTNAAAVADHALALLLALMRDIPGFDRVARTGAWRGTRGPRPIATGKRLGIVGLGGVGMRIARRAAAFEMEISYHTRRPRPDVGWTYAGSILELARRVDCLILAAPGGPQTFHAVDADVLSALGANGFLVNVGRGSIVDTQALIRALAAGELAGAALDVFEDEPAIPEALRALQNVIVTPHVAAFAPEVQILGARLLRENIENFLSGLPTKTPVPEFDKSIR